MRYLWHRYELSAWAMAMCRGSPYHLILFPFTIRSVESGELFCLHLAITGAQTLSTHLALKVGQLNPTQVLSTLHILSMVALSILRPIQKASGQWRGRCRRQGGSTVAQKSGHRRGCPTPSLQPTPAGRTLPCCVTRPRSREELSGPTT